MSDVAAIEQFVNKYKQLKKEIMRTLNNNQISGTLNTTKSYNWNSKRRFR